MKIPTRNSWLVNGVSVVLRSRLEGQTYIVTGSSSLGKGYRLTWENLTRREAKRLMSGENSLLKAAMRRS